MLIISELWYEGKSNILIAIPNPDLLMQWAEMIEEKYSLPFAVASEVKTFDYDGIVLTTYDYLSQNIEDADKINWDVIVFEEANALSSVYQDETTFMGTSGSKQAKLLKEFASNTFKILLTGTPIEKNIMDLYGLIFFIDDELWELVKYYFDEYNKNRTDCTFIVDDEKRTVKAIYYEQLPHLFYYPSSSGNKAYRSLKSFKNISLLSPLAKGIIFNAECADSGTITAECEKCTIALYIISVYAGRREIKSYPVFVGVTEDGRRLNHTECEKIFASPVYSYTEDGARRTYWLKSSKHHQMDTIVDLDEYERQENERLTPAQHEEIERMKLAAVVKKNGLNHALDDLELQMKELNKVLEALKGDRLKLLVTERKVSQLKNEMLKKKEGLFFDEMQIDVDLEKKINEFLGREKISVKADRQFILEINS